MTGETLLVATRSAGKLAELAPLLEAAGFHARSLDDAGLARAPAEDALESFDTFEENALTKARYFLALGTGLAVLADDSGLSVNALGGAPGVRSRRWSDRALAGVALDAANNRALLAALAGAHDRRARFVCVAAIAWRGGETHARGESAGAILLEPRGANGFGYDPLFLSEELAKTFAEATRDEKARVSHRARAVRAVLARFASRATGADVDPARDRG